MSLAKRMADGEKAKEQLEEIGEEIDEDTKKQIDLLNRIMKSKEKVYRG